MSGTEIRKRIIKYRFFFFFFVHLLLFLLSDEFLTSVESPALYLGCSWDCSEIAFVPVS